MKAASKSELARKLGKSEGAIRKWMKDPRWPFKKTGPWDVEKVRDWARKTLAPENLATDKPRRSTRKPAAAKTPAETAAPTKQTAAEVEQGGDEPALSADGAGDEEFDWNEERRVNIKLKKRRASKLQLEIKKLRATHVPINEVREAWVTIGHEVKTNFLNLPDAMAGILDQQQREDLRSRIDDILKLLSKWPPAKTSGN